MQTPITINFDDSDPEYGGAIYQGSTFEAFITIRDLDGVPVSLADYTVRGQARKNFKDVNPAFSFTTTLEPITEEGIEYPSAVVHMYLGANQTSAYAAGLYKYDVELVSKSDPANTVLKPFLGVVKVKSEVTK